VSDTATLRRYVGLVMQVFIIATIGIAGVTLLHFAGQAATASPPQPEQFRVTVVGLLIVAGMLVVVLATALRREVESES
jgi:membrane protein implicated in regulation of membrane protease activity